MKKIIYIARNELYSLFYSPIAWILMIIFLVMTSADYIYALNEFTGLYERGNWELLFVKELTNMVSTDFGYGYLFGIIKNLFIFFPLITMGLVSREVSSGTIKLLYSSPVRIREIVMGKYLAILSFALCLIGLILFILTAMSLSVAHPDYGYMLASVFGIFLVLATYAAIGLFISSLTSYQVVAALITIAVFALFSEIGNLWQSVKLVRGITYYLNMRQKSNDLLIGVMNTRDIIYFMILIVSFLLFTVIRIKSAAESISKFRKALRYIIVIIAAFIIGYITNKPQLNVYFDANRDNMYTITPPTQAMLAKLNDGELEISVVSNVLDKMSLLYFLQPSEQNSFTTNMFESYIRFKPDIKVDYLYYYNTDSGSYFYQNYPGKSLREVADIQLKTYNMSLSDCLSPEQINPIINTDSEENRTFFLLRYKGRSAVVRTYDDPRIWPGEDEIAAAINRLIDTPPQIDFLCDEIERSPFSERTRDYRDLTSKRADRHSLINQGYNFDTLSLKQKEIPKGLAALVIADPRTPISPENLGKINKYIDEGGNVFIAGEPDRKEVTKPLFDKLGLALRNGLLIQSSAKFSSDVVFTHMTDSARNLSPQFTRQLQDDIRYFGDTIFRVAMAGAGAIDFQERNGFRITPLLYTDSKLSWNRMTPISNDSLQMKVDRLPGDEQGSFTTAIRLDRTVNGREQRIIVAGDADYLTKPQTSPRDPRRYNYEFGFWCFNYFSYGQFPTNTLRPRSLDNSFKIKVAQIGNQKIILYWIIPGLIAIFASVILIRRKRK